MLTSPLSFAQVNKHGGVMVHLATQYLPGFNIYALQMERKLVWDLLNFAEKSRYLLLYLLQIQGRKFGSQTAK